MTISSEERDSPGVELRKESAIRVHVRRAPKNIMSLLGTSAYTAVSSLHLQFFTSQSFGHHHRPVRPLGHSVVGMLLSDNLD